MDRGVGIARLAAAAALLLSSVSARAGEASASFAVGARVVRSASFAVREIAGASGNLSAQATRGGAGAGVAVATESEWRSVPVRVAALSDVAALPRTSGENVLVTVLPDGRPQSVRFVRR